jgi:O-antigen/teichoic acid export membrane protein
MGLMLMLAMPLLLIPDLLIQAWIRRPGFHDSYAVMAILAAVLLVHSPISVLTQFLVARAQQRPAALIAIATTLANLALSFVLASAVGLWGVAVSTLITDLVAFAWISVGYAAPAASIPFRTLLTAVLRPVLPAIAAAVPVLVVAARLWEPRTLPALALLGLGWTVAGAFAIWRFGLSDVERARFSRELRGGSRTAPAAADI